MLENFSDVVSRKYKDECNKIRNKYPQLLLIRSFRSVKKQEESSHYRNSQYTDVLCNFGCVFLF